MIKNLIAIITIVTLSLIVTNGYMQDGLPGTDDGIWAPVRLASMVRELRQGQFPVRWSSDLNFGYGYPLFHFSYPGTYYFATILYAAGLGLVDTVKLVFIIGVASTSLGTYYILKNENRSIYKSLFLAIFTLSSPYLATNLYKRGSIGEILALGMLPWILLLGSNTVVKKSTTNTFLFSIAIASLILIHNATSLLSMPLIFTYLLVVSLKATHKAKSWAYKLHLLLANLRESMLAIFLGLLLSAFFFIPALSEVQYTKISEKPLTYIEEWFVSPQKSLLYPLFNNGPENLNSYYLSVGIFHTLALLIILIVIWKKKEGFDLKLFSILILVQIFLLFPVSVVVWKNLPLLKSIDFPWRILGPLTIAIPLLINYVHLKKYLRYTLYLIAITSFIIAVPTFRPKDLVKLPESAYATNQATATSNNEYISKWMPQAPQSQATQKLTTINGKVGEIDIIKESSLSREIKIYTQTPATIEYALMYAPGWQATINSELTPISYEQNGLVRLNVPEGESQIKIEYKGTNTTKLSNVVSISTLVVMIIFLVTKRTKKSIQ